MTPLKAVSTAAPTVCPTCEATTGTIAMTIGTFAIDVSDPDMVLSTVRLVLREPEVRVSAMIMGTTNASTAALARVLLKCP